MAKKEGVLSRFGDIMSANMHALLDGLEDPSKMVDQQLRSLRNNLADVKEATAEVIANETQCKRVVEDYKQQVAKYDNMARNALKAGDEDSAKKCIEKKQQLTASLTTVEKALELASLNADRMRKMHDKLVNDINYCESQRASVKATTAMAKAQEKVNDTMDKLGDGSKAYDAFGRMQEKAQRRLDKATAEASLMAGESDPLASIEAKYASGGSATVDDELEAMKRSMGI